MSGFSLQDSQTDSGETSQPESLQETCINVILDCEQLETIIKDFVTNQIMSHIITKQIFKKTSENATQNIAKCVDLDLESIESKVELKLDHKQKTLKITLSKDNNKEITVKYEGSNKVSLSGEPNLVPIAYLAIRNINILFKENDTYYAQKINKSDASINYVLNKIYKLTDSNSFEIYETYNEGGSEEIDIKEAFINYHLDNYTNIFNGGKSGGKVRRKKRTRTSKNSKHKKSKKGNKNKKRTRTSKR